MDDPSWHMFIFGIDRQMNMCRYASGRILGAGEMKLVELPDYRAVALSLPNAMIL